MMGITFTDAIVAGFWLFWFVLLALTLRIAFRVLRSLWRTVTAPRPETTIAAMALAASFLLVPTAVSGTAYGLFSAFFEVVERATQDVVRLTRQIEMSRCSDATQFTVAGLNLCLEVAEVSARGLTRMFVEPWIEFGRNLLPSLSTVLVAVLVAAAVAGLLQAARAQDAGRVVGRYLSAGASLPPRMKDVLLVTLLLGAGYLALAAMIAVPGLRRESLPETYKTEMLEARITPLILTPDGIETRLGKPDISAVNGSDLSTLEISATLDSEAADSRQRLRKDILTAFEYWRTSESGRASEIADLWPSAVKIRTDVSSTMARQIIDNYRFHVDTSVRPRETMRYFQNSVGTFERWTSQNIQLLSGCSDALRRYADYLSDTRRRFELLGSVLIASPQADDEFQNGALPFVDQLYDESAKARDRARNVCTGNISLVLPTLPNAGSSFGFLGLTAGWLLAADSMPLTLIVGMLGFGLLGATFSTFVREQRDRTIDPHGPLVQDVLGVVIRGVSAAVAVFLGVYGGLALIASGGEPDPYVMFFICLVGAVFSEVVWAWARERLQGTLAGEQMQDAEQRGNRSEDTKANP